MPRNLGLEDAIPLGLKELTASIMISSVYDERSGFHDVAFRLTPALSLGERENHFPVLERIEVSWESVVKWRKVDYEIK